MTKTISILGSTGSIGRQTLDVVRHLPIRVAALSAGTNAERMAEQIREFHPRLVSMGTEAAARELRSLLTEPMPEILYGEAGLLAAASVEEADTVLTAVVGMVGLKPTLAALERGKRIGLANKETMVCAGELVMQTARANGAEIIPVDSEHSAIFQCLMGSRSREEVKRLILTCSGGPFFGRSRQELRQVTRDDALRHPNWKMGEKITIDCATLMNKGLEVIEAMRLYELPAEQVDVVIHRQSIVHSLVEFVDGAVLAQLGVPDMRIPIQLALTYPKRVENPAPGLDLLSCPPLSFAAPDPETFACFAIARAVAKQGGTACAVMNGANELAVEKFLRREIGFYEISDLVQAALDAVPFKANPSLEEILEADRLARALVESR
ncbi:MAG: 1-deoxy-D-xylulose-5-phosphate reductoisomerase [Oscillospiraceae bacterium]|nr:1-deoxy-D-xylulose-5-phosphate reductoisomerase [Oscillospiraceae bacterium]